MASINNIKVGQTLYDCHKYKNNAGQSILGTWPVVVIEVNTKDGYIIGSWNGNKPKKIRLSDLKRLKVNYPKQDKK